MAEKTPLQPFDYEVERACDTARQLEIAFECAKARLDTWKQARVMAAKLINKES